MFKMVATSFVLVAALILGTPASQAGELEVKPIKSAETCSCTARHEALIEMRDYLKEMKEAQEAEAAAVEAGESETVVLEEEAQAGS